MKARNFLVLAGVIVVLAILFYTFQDTSGEQGYVDKIRKERTEKDHYMRTAPDSPFAGATQAFEGLKYFPIDPHYRINADLEQIEHPNMRLLATSDGKERRYIEYGYAAFDLDNRHNKLLILEIVDDGPDKGTLFLSFGDATSAVETYGAGRYLEIKKVPGSTSITLDFNKAYNPYCAYNDKFSCPLPPKENLMDIAINAGEKNYTSDEN